ncbi:MAG: hypothetical protein IT462_17300 [Planctomycetes bacterium]|nr:hypothetical protein [Planctomycetota bacterium]
MKPLVITGPSANSGKTELACQLLRRHPGIQVLKITRFHRESHCPVHSPAEDHCDGCDDTPAGYEIVADDSRIKVAGKDTGRLAEAGGEPVLWLRAAPHAFNYALKAALARFNADEPLLIEGNSAATQDWLDATVVLIWPQHPKGVKASVLPALRRADRLILIESSTAPGKRVPPSLVQACNRIGISLAQLPYPEWLSAFWWKAGQMQPVDENLIGGISSALTSGVRTR